MSCDECKSYLIDYDWSAHRGTGKRQQRHGEDWKRTGPPPCLEPNRRADRQTCPKECPEKEAEHVLSEKNRATVSLYWQVRATHGACLTGPLATDATLLANLSTVDQTVRSAEQQQLMSGIALGVAGMLIGR